MKVKNVPEDVKLSDVGGKNIPGRKGLSYVYL